MEGLFLPNKRRIRKLGKVPLKDQFPFNDLLCQYHNSVVPREKLAAVSPLSAFYRNASSYSTRNANYSFSDNNSSLRSNEENNQDDLSDVTENNDLVESADDDGFDAPDLFKKGHKETRAQIMLGKIYTEEQCSYYRKCMEDGIEMYIPKDVLAACVNEDIFESHDDPRMGCSVQTVKDTLLTLVHSTTSYILFICGSMMDELRLCSAASLGQPFIDRRGFKPIITTAFTIPVGLGSSLRQLCNAGYCDNFSASQVLARTQKEVTLLRTTSTDHMSPAILEPLQRWQLPHDILDMSSSSSGAFSTASILTDKGTLYMWTPMNGLQQSSDRAVIPSKYRHSSASPSMLTCCSQHNPVETYATYGRHLFSIDTRCDRAGTHLYSAGSSSITAVSDSSVDPHSLLLAVGKDIALMDRRFTKTFISKRSVGQATTMMKSIYGHSVLADALLTSSCGATQILIHSIAHARNAATSPLGILQCGALPHGCSSSGLASWTVTALPVADCSGADGVGSHVDAATLCGFDIISLCDYQSNKGSATDYMLVQQNTMGDVYCQRLRNRVGELDTTEKSADRSSDLPPVHSRLPIGHRYHDLWTSSLLNSHDRQSDAAKEDFGRTVKFPVCDMDYYVEKKLPSQATIEYAYPVASSCFYKFVPEETLKRFDLLLLLPNQVKTGGKDKCESGDSSAAASLEQVLETFATELANSGQRLTLWEAWHYVTTKTAQEVDMKMLRQTLLGFHVPLVEDIVAANLGDWKSEGTSDGLVVVVEGQSSATPTAPDEAGNALSRCCTCEADSFHCDVAAEGLCHSRACLRAHMFVYRSSLRTIDDIDLSSSEKREYECGGEDASLPRSGHIDFFRSNRTSQNSTAAKSCSSNMNNNSNNNNNIDNNDNSKRSGGRPSNSRRRAEISDDLISSLSERWTQLTDIVLTTHMK